MAQYYSHAYFTIAVERSWDSNTHFLRDVEDRWQPMSYTTTDHDGRPFKYHIQEHYSHEAFLNGLSNYFKRGKDILISRGWCLQEAVLSTRLIHFTPSDIIWECKSTMKCFDEHHHPDQAEWTIRKTLTELQNWPVSSIDQSLTTGSEVDRQVAIYKAWTGLVSKYTLRTLSFQEDKLPAFGGIASYFSQSLAQSFACISMLESGRDRTNGCSVTRTGRADGAVLVLGISACWGRGGRA
ncbi:hypothetical protein NW766_008703 [Fusarium irregulare]|uniref:Heterokaryon incompatibility domain-containing protein n=1 Tax=Fusarium irregulare TaxID=2494466 RepID=A0A9W8U7P8_9HYPO|nr:hypothetical protein NW766_008703 [Fusarium irregulare]